MRILSLIFLIFYGVGLAKAQQQNSISSIHVHNPVCIASGKVEKSFIPPPADFLLKSGEQKSDIILRLDGFPEEAKTALEYAVSIWESIIESDMPIHLYAKWSSTLGTNTLASCGPETYYSNFKNAPLRELYYPVAIAEKLAGEELNGVTRNDLEASFSSKINWYYGTDGNTPTDKYDFVSVALHEIAHGLGFIHSFFVSGDVGAYAVADGHSFYEMGTATTFDWLVETFTGKQLIDTTFYENASPELKNVLESNSLYANSPVAKISNSGNKPRLYAPSIFEGGSSVSHLNENTYPNGTDNSMMTPKLGFGEAIHDPGPLTLGIMEDVGWTNLFLKHTPVKDKEQIEPLVFTVDIDSYYPLAKNSAHVYYSTDNFITRDTLALIYTGNEGEYSATLNPDPGWEGLQYFVEVADIKDRKSTSPWNAPRTLYNIHFGPDTEDPVVTSEMIPYFLLRGEPLQVHANVDDNLGIDTVMVTYAINDVVQPPFGLTLDYGTNYIGNFPLDLDGLKDGDIVTYNILAYDASTAQNSTIFPENDVLQFRVEEIFEPLTNYINDFNETTPDFIIADFDIYKAKNFDNGALHSLHPYESPNQDNKDLNFSTFLKFPIILQESGEMSYDEVVLVEPGGFDDYGEFHLWDYVIVEGSKDYGETWYELADGYDSGDNATWEQNYNAGIVGQDSETEGSSDWFVTRNIDLLQTGNFNAGDTILIRFRLYSDPYARGWGWAVDNLRIQKPVAAPVTNLSPGQVNVYPNPFDQQFKVEIETEKILGDVQIDIYDTFGRNLYSVNYPKTNRVNETLNFDKYPAGLYLLKVSENGQPIISKKLIKR